MGWIPWNCWSAGVGVSLSADYFGLAVGLMCASATETIFDRELRKLVEREMMSDPPAAIPPVPGAIAPTFDDDRR